MNHHFARPPFDVVLERFQTIPREERGTEINHTSQVLKIS